MRVTTGKFKGRTLRTVQDLSVRPATDRVRQTIFNVLAHRMVLDGCRVLDLFAGSGSLGIEALSRGAAHATFVEEDGNALEYLEANLGMLGAEADATVLQMDAIHFLRQSSEPFDLIFADPPYAYAATAEIPQEVFSRSLLTGDGYLLIEHARPLEFAPSAAWTTGPVKQFGRTVVTFFARNTLP
ncbi:MAG TPA: 16S rRNA (guanine(966)-N(2))-methyltransferase RsmD [Bacteroidota bacterium]|nr:16S rRNA (guanine(966)-N(2))-methyltransferase RsmD [Bacteroidota bacterium]